MMIRSVFPSRSHLAVCVLLGQVCWATPAAAQFDYQSQSRRVDATAQSYLTTLVPPTSPGGSPTYQSNGVTVVDSAVSEAQDFGTFDRTVSATATYAASTSTVNAALQSSLGLDGVRMSMSYSIERVGFNSDSTLRSNSASFNSSIQFRMNDTTTVAWAIDGQQPGPAYTIKLTDLSTGSISNLAGTGAATMSLMPGDYTLDVWLNESVFLNSNETLRVGASAFSFLAVPEASTWAMMCLGLVGVGAWTRRRRHVH